MFSDIDFALYPDDCEVAEMPLHDQWVYMIQKNGTSSIREDRSGQFRILKNEQIKDLDFVDIYIRDPKTRYVSGVNTFVQHTLRDRPDLDKDTVTYFATNYLFLNRHYLPQILWIFNLLRWLSPTARLRLHDFKHYGDLVNINHRALIDPADTTTQDQILAADNGMALWWFADQILLDHAGQTMTWNALRDVYRRRYPDVWQSMTSTTQKMHHVLQ
jgi:hypothetical protein